MVEIIGTEVKPYHRGKRRVRLAAPLSLFLNIIFKHQDQDFMIFKLFSIDFAESGLLSNPGSTFRKSSLSNMPA
ncbi:MAG: hypothetical protein B6D78_00565, partial [gamma proteobacterium symbiont of Ctena orbiculata]